MNFCSFFNDCTFCTNTLLIVGFITIVYNLYLFVSFVYRKFLRTPQDIYQIYGQSDSWAVVTGSSDGIGKAFSESLAAKGFNICFIARNLEKIELVRKEIQANNPQIKTSIIIADFSFAPQDPIVFFQKINKELIQQNILNVAILVNNAGYADMARFENMNEKEIIDMLAINIYPVSLLSRILIPKMLTRNKKSLIINLASISAKFSAPFLGIYSASKSFNDVFAKSLAIEFEGRIDVMSLKPNYVSTKMTNKKKVGGLVITPKECADACLRDAGLVVETAGSWKHDVLEWLIINVIPRRVLLGQTTAALKKNEISKKKK